MSELINKYNIKIQLGVLITSVITLAGFVYTVAVYAKQTDINTADIQTFEEKMENLATKGDLDRAVLNLKDYINKK